ncbi:MAG: response regulator, partial [Deltaproteobacteria bacterium]
MAKQETHPNQAADLRHEAEKIACEEAYQSPENLLAMAANGDTILLVDDEPHELAVLTYALRRNPGYEVLTAASGSQALSVMESTKIKVIVTDERMVGMQGSELLAEVQRRFPHTIRVLLTGYATLEASMRATNEGQVYRFLTKPWDDGTLRLALSAATEKYNSDAEKRRLQDTLQQSEERYKTVVEFSPHAVVVHRDGKILYANPVAIEMFGAASLQDLAGSPILDRIHPDYHQNALARPVQRMTGEGASVPLIELKYLKIDGTIFDGEAQGTAIIYDGLPAIYAAICDITERKLQEEYLEMRQEVLSILNAQEGEAPDSIQRVLVRLKERTGCSAVALRLQEGEDFPYFTQEGFADDFLRTENTL